MKTKFITFGNHHKWRDYVGAGERLTNQAKACGHFDSTRLYTDLDLKKKKTFWNRHGEWFEKTKGFGYWAWKPYFILNELNNLVDGDVLMYADGGCEIGRSWVDRTDRVGKSHSRGKSDCDLFPEYFKSVQDEIIITTLAGTSELPYNKMDTIQKIGVDLHGDDIYEGQRRQYQATTCMFKVCGLAREFVKHWLDLCLADDYHYVDDSPSVLPNDSSFKQHRHDQSIYSLLLKKYRIGNEKNQRGNKDWPTVNTSMTDCIYINKARSRETKLPKCLRLI
tara:strand:- start:258 stop:1094 length:837 start_codon:yes stop_codon:yes gene_type:complete